MTRALRSPTRTVRLFTPEHPFVPGIGEEVPEVDVAYETYGELSEAKDNAIFICHALTGDAHAAGWHEGDKRPGWWDTMIGPGKPIDTDRFFVISANLLGGCSGTTGPASTKPGTDHAWGLDFPLLQMSDLVAVHRELIHHLGIRRLRAVIGGSLGGMQALEWSLQHPDEVANAVVIAASSRLTAQNIAFSAVARSAIMRDSDFHDGQYAAHGTAPRLGLSIARMMAHITYLSVQAMDEKFGRRWQSQPAYGFGADFQVESYLNHQGSVFLDRFDALSYLYLTRSMDYFDPFAQPGWEERINRITRFLVLSFDSDWRFDTTHSQRIVRKLENAQAPVTFREIPSTAGHDAFLLEVEEYHRTVRAFLDRAMELDLDSGQLTATPTVRPGGRGSAR